MEHVLNAFEIVRLIEEHQAVERWSRVAPLARERYGSAVRRVEIKARLEADKQPFVWHDRIQSIKFLGLGNWLLWSIEYNGRMYVEYVGSEQGPRRVLGKGSDYSILLERFPAQDHTYDLDRPPTLSFERVFIKDESGERELTRAELLNLADRYKIVRDWERVRTLVRGAYSEAAQVVVVRPTDFDFTYVPAYYSNLALDVYDATGQRLLPDLHLPVWETQEYRQAIEGVGEDDTWLDSAQEVVAFMLEQAGGVPQGRYALEEPPKVSAPQLYVLEEEAP